MSTRHATLEEQGRYLWETAPTTLTPAEKIRMLQTAQYIADVLLGTLSPDSPPPAHWTAQQYDLWLHVLASPADRAAALLDMAHGAERLQREADAWVRRREGGAV